MLASMAEFGGWEWVEGRLTGCLVILKELGPNMSLFYTLVSQLNLLSLVVIT